MNYAIKELHKKLSITEYPAELINIMSYIPLKEKYFKNELPELSWDPKDRLDMLKNNFMSRFITSQHTDPNYINNLANAKLKFLEDNKRLLPLPRNFNETDIQFEIRLLQILCDKKQEKYISLKYYDFFN